VQRLEQHLLRREIEVVGRLVEDEEVRRVEKHAGHDETVFSPPRQHADFLSMSSPEN
jgi:hypothetical protein